LFFLIPRIDPACRTRAPRCGGAAHTTLPSRLIACKGYIKAIKAIKALFRRSYVHVDGCSARRRPVEGERQVVVSHDSSQPPHSVARISLSRRHCHHELPQKAV
jgi:hypothetical protein